MLGIHYCQWALSVWTLSLHVSICVQRVSNLAITLAYAASEDLIVSMSVCSLAPHPHPPTAPQALSTMHCSEIQLTGSATRSNKYNTLYLVTKACHHSVYDGELLDGNRASELIVSTHNLLPSSSDIQTSKY